MLRIIFLLMFCAMSIQAQTQTAANAPAPKAPSADETTSSTYGTISGRVVSEDGPLPFAQVTILPVSLRNRGNSLRSALTDAEGNFKVDGLRAAAWNVIATAQGYVPEIADEEAPQNFYRIGETISIRMTKGGVITGRVLSASGEPLIAVPVLAQMVRDIKGQPASASTGTGFFQTDDRGVYRIYGLTPGSYVVSTGRTGGGGGNQRSPYQGDVPTYYPSATRDTALEVTVGSGSEAGGIDIQYRGGKGHSVSGKITGVSTENNRGGFGGGPGGGGIGVVLTHTASGTIFNRTFVMSRNGSNVYALNGVPDGEYEVSAEQNVPNGNNASSAPRKITVSGRDVTGIDLALLPTASITARLLIENETTQIKCEVKRKASFEEQLFVLHSEENKPNLARANLPFGLLRNDSARPVAPDRAGEFSFRDLLTGHYRLLPKMLDENFYIRSITTPGAIVKATAKTPAKQTMQDAARNGINIKSGEKLTGLTVKIAEGAASLQGKIKAANNGPLPGNLRIYLLPIEREKIDDVLRYAVTVSSQENIFKLTNLAPGKYFILAKIETDDAQTKIWNVAERTKIRREAEAANTLIELQPCQKLQNYELNYRAAAR